MSSLHSSCDSSITKWDPTSHQVPSAKYLVKPKINHSECIAGVKWVEKYGHTSQNKNKDFEAYWHSLMPEECIVSALQAPFHWSHGFPVILAIC
ncbi:hypothetical protein P691DRAFT_70119 [Macrolepiota fuliginosa MF-IS2]|uniref:Uncharacterized protein n=1 Tax=Macrolepiota fuliginosa MF-IS2 TaxID=1400762 RepID=A0A9P5WXD3_9AGAR|nr:hypothetical protein P691DRAFT_70119 [Macrolepiota fuliginosa MF-IS2]